MAKTLTRPAPGALDPARPITCAGLAVRKLSRAVSRVYDEALQPVGLTSGQFMILAHVVNAPGINMSRLATALGMDRSTLTRLVGPLVEAGYVTTGADEDDQRAKKVMPTAEGRQKFDVALESWTSAQDRVLERLALADLGDFVPAVRKATEVFGSTSESREA
jgi:DNA-binding MarR family transcriptional regulator